MASCRPEVEKSPPLLYRKARAGTGTARLWRLAVLFHFKALDQTEGHEG